MWRDTRQPIVAHLGDSVEPAQFAPHGRHLLEPPPPELPIEPLERQLGEGGPDRALEVVAQVAFAGRCAPGGDGCPLTLDLRAAGKCEQTLAVHREWDNWEVGTQARALV